MKWLVLSPFAIEDGEGWLFDAKMRGRHVSQVVPRSYHHDRSRPATGGREWRDYFLHGWRAVKMAWQSPRDTGVITLFPQLAAIMALFKCLGLLGRRPLLAWCFNMGRPYGGVKGVLARAVMSQVDLFVVYSRAEIDIYSQWLGVPPARFCFVPLTGLPPPMASVVVEPDDESPYVLAMGTANRDYRTFMQAMAQVGHRAIVISGPHALEGLVIPPNVEVRSGVPQQECHRLAKRARLNVIPIADADAASGQVTLIDSMMLRLPLVVTRCAGTQDYAQDGVHALLVPPAQSEAMAQAIEQLWGAPERRSQMAQAAQAYAFEHYTPEAVKKQFAEILERLSQP
jgi:glycosyltransferase involved in cell wall biosynthesis